MKRQGGIRHRDCKMTGKERERKKLLGKGNWYKGKKKTEETTPNRLETNKGVKRKRNKDNRKETTEEKEGTEKEPITVLFVPRTPQGELAKLIKQKEEEIRKLTTHRIRIVERNGTKIEHILTKPDPFGVEKCQKDTCLVCLTDEKEKGRCKTKNVVYKIECKICKKEGKSGVYWGETARTAQLRGGNTTKT